MKWNLVIALFMACVFCSAQDGEKLKAPAKFYKLDFVLKDLEGGKVLNSHNYSMIVSTGNNPPFEIRAGSKVPISNSSSGSTMVQYQMYDIGTNVDCRNVEEAQENISLDLTVESTSLLQESASPTPTIRQNKWSSKVLVPLKRPTVVFSSDDATTKHVLEFEVTATPR